MMSRTMEIFQVTLLLVLISMCVHSSSSSLQSYNEPCKEDKDCDSGFCNPKLNSCDCLTYKDQRKNTMEKQYFDHELKMCFSKVGQLCTLPEITDHLTLFQCVPDSECKASHGQPWSTEFFGTCKCKYATQPSADGKMCISNVEMRTVNAKISSMNQIREGGNGVGSTHGSLSTILLISAFASVMCSFSIR